MNYNPLFDVTDVDTPVGVAPTVALADISGVPATGTGLAGAAYVDPDRGIWSIERLEEVITETAPVLTFTSSELNYRGFDSENTIADFLGDDAASITGGDGNAYEMGPSGFVLTGYIYIPEGVHELTVNSDDGFTLTIGGVPFSEFLRGRGPDDTSRVAQFDGGLYQIDMLYFDGGGGHALNLKIDGLTVDQSAFYLDPSDFQNPPAGVPVVPVEDYHPSYFIEVALDIETTDTATEGHDVIQGLGADETIDGLGGDDIIRGGYGDDSLSGGDGDDLLDGERGSDIVYGGKGDDLLIARSDGGEQRIGQLAIGDPTRPDTPEGDVNEDRQKLKGYEDQPLIGDDILFGGEGSDTFLISPLLNGKLEIIEKHTRSDGSIRWAGVAGENTYLHDHWPDMNGIEIIGDYNAEEDTIAVIGHTANVYVEYRDTDGDGDEESIITIISNQHGGGGAHDDDLLGFAIVHGDRVEEGDIITDAGVTYGIVENYADVVEALFPVGDLKVTEIDGELVYGYDTRDADGNLGPITGSPEDYVDNPYLAGVTFADPSADDGPNLTRDPFEQLGFSAIAGETITGGPGDDEIRPAETTLAGLPGALAFYSFSDTDGSYEDARGGPSAKAYTLYESQAVLRTDGITTGPDGVTLNALEFNGEDQFAHIQHDVATNVTQGTIALWVRPDDLSEFSTMVSKDQSGTGDGGHFRLSHTEDGALYLRFAPGDGGGNKAWKTANPQLTEGEWSHLAVSYGADGVTVYVDGKAIPDFVWYRVEGNVETPGVYEEAYMVANEEAWLLGADSYVSKGSTTAAEFAVNDDRLQKAFDGAIAEFGVWGGFTEDDILTKSQINELIDDGPGAALTNPSGPQPIIAGDDLFQGGDGDDMIFGEGGDDTLEGGAGDDTIEGGYGDDSINGGDGADVLDGGRGNDLVIGGLGNDVLYSRSDAGEQRLGQLVLDDPSRPDDGSIDYDYLKLVDWIDQPLKADDVLVGGEGNDLFYFEPLLNAKKDIILEHVREDRTINWAGVAGENTYLHDHWADQFGIDIIADYVAAEDTIAVIGHTANILSVEHQTVDTDGDGINDSAMSLVQVYSQQGNNGGAHDEDLLGMIVVFGDLVYEDDIVTNPGVTPGIVDTIDELQEALAPTGETKVTFTADGVELFGYDSRDVEGDPLGTDPLSYSDNPFLAAGDVTFQNQLAELGAPVILLENAGGTFDGEDDFVEVLHEPELAQAEGAWTFSFNADTPGDGDQTLLSKDHSGLKDGGHLTFWVTDDARLEVRFQSETRSYHIKTDRNAIEPGETYSVAFNFIEDEISLYLDGDLVGSQSGFPTGMLGNTEDLVIGSSSTTRNGDKDNLKEFFDGTISDIAVFDRALEPIEVLLLAEASGSATTIGNPPPPPPVAGIVGDEAANRLNGTAEDDVIDGAGGNDIINGLGGADIMMGGDGDDRFYCDDEGDQIIEAAGGGYDRVYTSVSATLSANVEAVKATGTTAIDLTGNASDNWIDGNSAANTLLGGEGSDRLRGREGDDVLDGEGGNDILEGGTGSDIFRVGPDGGVDMVLDFELGLDRIDLTATGASPAGLTINDSAQGARIQYDDANLGNVVILKGVYASDLSVLDFIHEGISAAEMIQGTDANDVLRAWDGDAMLIGGAGDDRFYVDGPADQVIEALGEGYDRVYAQGEFTLSDNIEAISAHGSDAVVLTGNGLDNWVTGGAGDDTLSGEGGNDRLQGRDGADLLDGGLGNDILNGGTGSDIFRFEVGDGADLVQDFERGSDVIDLSGTGLSFGDLGIYDTAQGAMIFYRADDGSVLQFTMNGVTAGQISESDFAF